MVDYISREAAIEVIKAMSDNYTENGREYHPHVDMVVHELTSIPSADVEPVRHGRWEWNSFNIQCPFCGCMPYFDSTEPLYNYCPNCGARMDGE